MQEKQVSMGIAMDGIMGYYVGIRHTVAPAPRPPSRLAYS
jgi:hypothetical protein